jgi:hypothetical protein
MEAGMTDREQEAIAKRAADRRPGDVSSAPSGAQAEGRQREDMKNAALTLAEKRFGQHPMWWPTPPRARRDLRALESVFGPLTQAHLDRYWAEIAKGQCVLEDAGGYAERAYTAMLGLPVREPYTFTDALQSLGPEPRP